MSIARAAMPQAAVLARRLQPPLLWFIAILACVAAVWTGITLFKVRSANQAIARLIAHEPATVDVDARKAHPQVVLAQVNEHLRRDEFDEAQTLAASASATLDAGTRAEVLYNIANSDVHRALDAISKGDLDAAAARINLAKAGYRMALKLDPQNWDARNNLDVAMRIVRDLPQIDSGDQPQKEAPQKRWTDLPGIPKGLP